MSRHHQHASKSNFTAKPRFVVENKADAISMVVNRRGYFVKSKSEQGGLMAHDRHLGRVVFPDKRGPQPLNNGKMFTYRIIAENPKGTVFFAEIINEAPKIIKDRKTGKLRCVNQRPALLTTSKKADKKPLAAFRSAKPTDTFVRQDDDYSLDWFGSCHACECGRYDCDGEFECEGDTATHFDREVEARFDCLPSKPVHCPSCRFQDCRCDGTDTQNQPDRTTLDVLS